MESPSSKVSVLQSYGISIAFGGFKAVDQVSLTVNSGEILGILGPNGAGKTTLMNLLTGAILPNEGKVQLLGEDVTCLNTANRCLRGLARTHQIPRPFSHMTVFENVLVAVHFGRKVVPVNPYETAWKVMEMTELDHLANRTAESLGYLDRKRLELSRALATEPRILLLDEIGGGLTDSEGNSLVKLIKVINGQNITIIWIEHIVRLLIQACNRFVCMADGKLIADGTPNEVLNSKVVKSAYFGIVT